jgi:hypothetical protein
VDVIDLLGLSSDRLFIEHDLFRIAAAGYTHHASHFVADLELGRLGTAFLDDARNISAGRIG